MKYLSSTLNSLQEIMEEQRGFQLYILVLHLPEGSSPPSHQQMLYFLVKWWEENCFFSLADVSVSLRCHLEKKDKTTEERIEYHWASVQITWSSRLLNCIFLLFYMLKGILQVQCRKWMTSYTFKKYFKVHLYRKRHVFEIISYGNGERCRLNSGIALKLENHQGDEVDYLRGTVMTRPE